jgi:hypothetical protein
MLPPHLAHDLDRCHDGHRMTILCVRSAMPLKSAASTPKKSQNSQSKDKFNSPDYMDGQITVFLTCANQLRFSVFPYRRA